jgi:orotidine-5'-phosphate decarboxylase
VSAEKIIVAVDVDSASKAIDLVERLQGHVGAFKVGLELINHAGVDIFAKLKAAGADRIFYDAKLHDIPNTVAGACRGIARQGLWMVNIHASGGSRMIAAAREALDQTSSSLGTQAPLLIAVTLLTSIAEHELHGELMVESSSTSYVTKLARMARDAGAQGVVASPHEIEAIRAACGQEFVIVTPGVRPIGSPKGDQRRTMTPGEAGERGADYLVIGRPITAAADPVKAAQQIAEDIGS